MFDILNTRYTIDVHKLNGFILLNLQKDFFQFFLID